MKSVYALHIFQTLIILFRKFYRSMHCTIQHSKLNIFRFQIETKRTNPHRHNNNKYNKARINFRHKPNIQMMITKEPSNAQTKKIRETIER